MKFKRRLTFGTSIAILSVSALTMISCGSHKYNPVFTTLGNVQNNMATSHKTFDFNTSIDLSTDPNNPNVIEIFTDGFDQAATFYNLEQRQSCPTLKDFTAFENFYTGVSWTGIGREVALNGINYAGPIIHSKVKNKIDAGWDVESAIWREGVGISSTINHMLENSDKFSNLTVLNTVDMMGPSDNEQTLNYGGDSKFAEDSLQAKGINLVTLEESKKIIAKNPSLASTSFTNDATYSRAGGELFKTSDSAKGARVLLQNNISHTPRNTKEDGTFTSINQNINKGNLATLRDVEYVVNKLKGIVGSNGINAYDNSLIVVFGDHSDHDRPGTTLQESLVGGHSELMIKYPNEINTSTQKARWIKDKTVYASQLSELVNSYILNKPTSPWNIFNQKAFDLNRPVLFSSRQGNDTKVGIARINDPVKGMELDNDGFKIFDTSNQNYLNNQDIINLITKGDYEFKNK